MPHNTSQSAAEAQPRTGGIQDLFDPRQVALFDAFDQLSRLGDVNIEPPQLVVVGDQSSGKSSILEAIARFHFPVNDELCTRFPTKLVLRRSSVERTQLSIKPGDSRLEEDKKRLLQFNGELSRPDEFVDWMKRAAAELGVPSSTASLDGSPAGSRLAAPRSFTDDVLIVEKHGPDLPLVDLVDLPGLFQAASNEQDEASKQTVEAVVKEHVKSKRNLILLVVSARTSFHNHAGPTVIQDIAKNDPDLVSRLIGVMTSPDRAMSAKESMRVLGGRLNPADLKIYSWHVLKNQNQEERSRETLNQRDANEAEFFRNDPDWRRVPDSQRGIDALKATLKYALWEHTQASLPGLITEVKDRIQEVKSRLSAFGDAKATDLGRRRYLHHIAKEFETFTQQACQGIFQNNECKEPHEPSQECDACKRFFPDFADVPECRDKNLRASVRALSRAFASAMAECGRTKEIKKTEEDDQSVSEDESEGKGEVAENGSDVAENGSEAGENGGEPAKTGGEPRKNGGDPCENEGAEKGRRSEPEGEGELGEKSKATPVQPFPFKTVLEEYYTHGKPEYVERTEFEEWVAAHIDLWGGRGPDGEPSETAYHRFFEYQSKNWRKIARRHLEAVWKVVERFVHLALDAACPNEAVRQALRTHLAQPRLERLKKTSNGTLKRILHCHEGGTTGFYDGFVDVNPILQRGAQVSRKLNAELRYAERNFEDDPPPESINHFFGTLRDLGVNWMLQQTRGLHRPELIRGSVESFRRLFKLPPFLLGVAGSRGGTGEDQSANDAILGRMKAVRERAVAAQLIHHVEMYYETSMTAFVGYVNALVVENGILDELPKAILTQKHIMDADASVLEKIAGEKPSEARQREKDNRELEVLKKALETLEGYSTG